MPDCARPNSPSSLKSRATQSRRIAGGGVFRLRLPCHLHERGLLLHLRDGARPGCGLLREVPHQYDEGRRTRPRRHHIRERASRPAKPHSGGFPCEVASTPISRSNRRQRVMVDGANVDRSARCRSRGSAHRATAYPPRWRHGSSATPAYVLAGPERLGPTAQ